VGWVDMADELRSDAVQCIDYMKDNNIRTLLISGDNEEKTTYIARKLGIPEYYARKLPKEKLDMIDELNASGTTLMVGDGVNDAPALAKASIGVALSNASQVAIDAADVVLINSNLRSLNTAIGIAKHTVITIKQNLFWAFFYNVLAIPIAAAGFLNPMLAALAMAFSDVIVIGNSLRLKRKKIQ
jgi:Cu+-exporting ATPase